VTAVRPAEEDIVHFVLEIIERKRDRIEQRIQRRLNLHPIEEVDPHRQAFGVVHDGGC
jgi:hypothetical protein